MELERPYRDAFNRLKSVGLRPTRQRMALARLLFSGDDRHLTAEQLHQEAEKVSAGVSLATVYNTLHQFTAAGLLREVVVEPGRSIFDTNVTDHHHFYHTDCGKLEDIPAGGVQISGLPEAPEGTSLERVDVIVRLAERK